MHLLCMGAWTWACTLYLYLHNGKHGYPDRGCVSIGAHTVLALVRHGQPKRCAYCTQARVLGHAHCTCTYTVFGMSALRDAPIAINPVCLGVYTVRVRAQCLTGAA